MTTCSCCGRDFEVTVTLRRDDSTARCATCLAGLASEGRHVDPDGNVLRFGSPVRPGDGSPVDAGG